MTCGRGFVFSTGDEENLALAHVVDVAEKNRVKRDASGT